ncbi:MAG: nitrophenyl compound nitroreductase subunit ArsF family protein [Bacteroidales bacterium]|nr:nitrophenyl compound nitroreductase subunit ArsF family protein [Bacteroidales bacterium]
MKMLKILSLFALLIGLSSACTGQGNKSNNESSVNQADEVTVYYFHNTRRCATCKAVEAESEKAVQELYGDKVAFEVYNLESDAGEKKANEVGASGQSLLIVSGDEKINITNEGFMHARNNPEKLKQIIKGKIESLL